MNNKIVLTIFVTLFLMAFVQAEVFGTPETSCPEPVVYDTPEEVTCEEPNYILVIVVSFIGGVLLTFLARTFGKNLFKKKKKKTILDMDNNKPTDQMFEEASKDIEETKDIESKKGTRYRW